MKKKILALLLALACGLLAGCAPAAEPDAQPDGSDIACADWRTWGILNDMGTLVRDAEHIDVCVCVHTEDAAIYYDTAEQVLLAVSDFEKGNMRLSTVLAALNA